jgi:hypothetical protein
MIALILLIALAAFLAGLGVRYIAPKFNTKQFGYRDWYPVTYYNKFKELE